MYNEVEIRKVTLEELKEAGVSELKVISGHYNSGQAYYQVRLPLDVVEKVGGISGKIAREIREQRQSKPARQTPAGKGYTSLKEAPKGYTSLTAPIGESIRLKAEEVPAGE